LCEPCVELRSRPKEDDLKVAQAIARWVPGEKTNAIVHTRALSAHCWSGVIPNPARIQEFRKIKFMEPRTVEAATSTPVRPSACRHSIVRSVGSLAVEAIDRATALSPTLRRPLK